VFRELSTSNIRPDDRVVGLAVTIQLKPSPLCIVCNLGGRGFHTGDKGLSERAEASVWKHRRPSDCMDPLRQLSRLVLPVAQSPPSHR